MTYLIKSLITISTLVLILDVKAQYVEPDTVIMPERLNTVGINLTPPIVALLGGAHTSPRYSVMLKRQISVNKKIRLSFNYNQLESIEESGLDGSLVNFTDSTITVRNEVIYRNDYDLRIGLEFFKPYRKTTTVYGFDVIAGLYKDETTFRQVEYLKNDTSLTLTLSPYQAQVVTTRQIDYLYLGADFSIGQRVDISDSVNILVQWSPELTYRVPYRENYSDPSNRLEPAKEELYYNLRGFEVYFNLLF